MRTKSFCSLFAVLLVLSSLSSPAVAQDAEREFPEINRIIPDFRNFRSVSDQFVLGNVQLRAGMDYNPALVDQSVRTLYQSGQFEFVEVRVEQAAAGKVDVVFEITSKYTIEKIRYNGNNAFSDRRLALKAEISEDRPLESGIPLDEYEVSVVADAIEAYYVKKGYPDVMVDYRILRNDSTGYAEVNFDIEEGGEVSIKDITFDGNSVFSDQKLRKQLDTKKGSLLSWITGSGKYEETTFKEDLESLRNFYRDSGYLDSKIEETGVDIEFLSEDEIKITIQVFEGELYYLGDISVENNTVYTEEELLREADVESGQEFSPQEVDDAASVIRDYYTSTGYLDSRVQAERVPNMESRRIDVVFRVRESEKFYLESIRVEGNTKSKAQVIIRELALRPGDVFDLNRMETSQARLRNTRYFEDVRLSPEPTNIPGRRDLGVTVREGRTGSFTFGAGFGSIEAASVFFEVAQGNFDLFNWRSGFQGDGQKFRFRASVGTRSNQVAVTFIEPWLFEQRLEFGVELYRSESRYNSADYNELRTGFELFLRRRLFELVEARLAYRLELVEIFDVAGNPNVNDPNVADVFEEAEGEDLVSKVSFTLLRDNRDSLIFTRKGNRTTILNEYAGLGGDVNYYKLEVKTAQYFPTFDSFEQSVSVLARAGSTVPLGANDTVPFYDRFYLGGPQTLRGYDFRDIGPRDDDDDDESIGGNTYSMFSLEYMFRVAEPLGLVVFYDAGFVNPDEFDFSVSDYADNWGFGARIMLMGSPLQLDYGIPITSPDNSDGGGQFQFSFGTRF